MARAATTADVFNAIAEPRRRQIIELLARRGTLGVSALVLALGMPQPAVSKHLSVLRQVGIVSTTQQGQQRIYELQPHRLREVNDWIKQFERFWTHQLDRIKQRAERTAKLLKQSSKQSPQKGSS
jgi:DNA-binding transcriptional ArsR family regulator